MKVWQKWRKGILAALSTAAIGCLAFACALIAPFQGTVSAETATGSNTIDFSSSTDANKFSTISGANLGTVTDGKYYPNAWAQNYLTVPVQTDSTYYISFDFYAPSIEENGDTYSQMWASLITDTADINNAEKSLGVRFFTGASNCLTSSAQKADGYYLSETAEQLIFGTEHHMDIFVQDGTVSFAVDGTAMNFLNSWGTDIATPWDETSVNQAYLYFEFSHAGGWIDNVVIGDGTDMDFPNSFIADKFIGATSEAPAVTVTDGKWYPVSWGRYYYNLPLDIANKDLKITYDFYVTARGTSTYTQLYAALVSDLSEINGTDKSISFRVYNTSDSNSYSVFPSAQTTSGFSSLAWKTDMDYSGAEHTMEVKIKNGAITYSVDGVMLFGKTFTAPTGPLYLFWEFSKNGGYIDNLKIEELPFEEINLDFSTSAQGTNNFVTTSGSSNWAYSDGTWKSGGTYRISYLTTPIPISEFKYIAFDWYEPNVANDSAAANLRLGLVDNVANKDTAGHSIGLHFWPTQTYLTNMVTAANAWLKTLTDVSLGVVHRLEMVIQNEKITFIIDGTTLQSSYDIPFADQDTSTKDYAYLMLDDAVGKGAYIDNLVVWNEDTYNQYRQEQLDKEYGIEEVEKSFDGYDIKSLPLDGFTASGKSLSTLTTTTQILRSGQYDVGYSWLGAQYYAMRVNNNADTYVALGVDVAEGKGNTSNYGLWWTAAEGMPYYLLYDNGTVKSGVITQYSNNRGKAVIPTGFSGELIIPITSFEILDWSANKSTVLNWTQDAEAIGLDQIGWTDVNYVTVSDSATGSLTVSAPQLYGKNFANSTNVTVDVVAKTIKAIDDIGVVSLASEAQIAFASKCYNALTAEQQESVTNYETLTAAKTAFYALTDYSYAVGTDGKDFTGTGGVAFGKNFGSPATVSAWIKVRGDVADSEHVGTVVGNAERAMSSSILYDSSNSFSFEITTNGNPKFEWRKSRTAKAVFVVENVDVRTGSWLHVAFTKDADNGVITCYINGVAVASMTTATENLAAISYVKPVMVGSDYTDDDILASGFSPDFHGYIADVCVYSGVLSESEVYNDMLGDTAEGLLGAIDFASGEVNSYYDSVNEDATNAFGWEAVEDSAFAAADGEFTFAIIPDTQMLFSVAGKDTNGVSVYNDAYQYTDNAMAQNVQWLIDNQDLFNLEYVMHVGDLTDNLNYYTESNVDSTQEKWQVEGKYEAQWGFKILEMLTGANIPYSISRGNHDGGYRADALALWDTYWKASTAYTKATTTTVAEGAPARYYGNSYGTYSYYENLEINGIKYLILVLDLEAGDDILEWANSVASYYTDHRIIVSTHAYIGAGKGYLTSLMGTASKNNSGSDVYTKFVSLHSNIQLVVCGHSSGEDIIRRQDTREDGSKVWTVMIDASAHEFTGSSQAAIMSLMKFSADGNTLTFSELSPTDGRLFRNYNQFSITLGDVATEEVVNDFQILDTDGKVVYEQVGAFNGELPVLNRTGRVFLGYAIDGALYPAGTVYDSASGKSVVAVFANFSMVNGAAVRLSDPSGLRFQTYLDVTAYGYVKDSVKFGTLIADSADMTVNGVVDYGTLTVDATMTKLNIVSTVQHEKNGNFYFNGAVVGIQNIERKFAARGYMTVTYADGSEQLFYANVTNNVRSVAEVAAAAIADTCAVESKTYDNYIEESGLYSCYTTEEIEILKSYLSA